MSSSQSHLLDLDRHAEELRRRYRVRLRRTTKQAFGDAVGPRTFPLLEQLVEHGPLSPTDLAQRLELRTSTIAAHIDRLEEMGWAARAAKGRRGVLVSPTPAGRLAHDRFLVVRREALGDLLSPLAEDDLMSLGRLLERLATAEWPQGTAR